MNFNLFYFSKDPASEETADYLSRMHHFKWSLHRHKESNLEGANDFLWVQKIIQQKKISGAFILLDEHGKCMPSIPVAHWLKQILEASGGKLNFVIGGAMGVSPQLKNFCQYHWSLTPLTLPHSYALKIFAEAMYRSYTIWNNHPYHHV